MRTRFIAEEQRSWDSFRKAVNDGIKTFTDEECKGRTESKSSLVRYRQFKLNRGTIDHIYDNSKGSTPLASARARFLNTNSFRARFEGGDGKCVLCGHHTEVRGMEIEIRKRLGPHEDSMSETVEQTKRNLERWDRATKDYSPGAPRINRR